jgi:site-specific DNA-methyltransferase (adenine-specific)
VSNARVVLASPEQTVLHAEALDALAWLRKRALAPRLVYLDPPFAVGKDFAMLRDAGGHGAGTTAYSDRWENLDAYLASITPVLDAVHETLADDGSLLLHCDHRTAPYLAMRLDQRFGFGDRGPAKHAPGFRNALVWTYGLGGSSKRCYPKKHDTIFWYTKSADWYFDPPMVPATSHRMRGQQKKAPDVLAVPALNNMASERTGYPTQKPLALLELLVGAHTEPGDLVVDVMCGSGTTGVAARRLGRRCVVSDRGDAAVEIAAERLRALCEVACEGSAD